MPFPSVYQSNDRFYNNADSFAMAFDDRWKDFSLKSNKTKPTKEEKLNAILSDIKDHPFMKSHPTKAQEIAKFRLRLLNLE